MQLLRDQAPGADGAVQFALGFEVERHEAKPPVALHVQRLHHSAAVRARAARRLPSDHPLIFVANEHQAHPLSLSLYEFN